MKLSGKLVQVARPSEEHSLLQAVVGTAWWLGFMFPEFYVLAPERAGDAEMLKGELFNEAELEQLQ